MSTFERHGFATVACSTDVGTASTAVLDVAGTDNPSLIADDIQWGFSRYTTPVSTRSELTDQIHGPLPSYPRPGPTNTTILPGDSAYTVRYKYNLQMDRSRSAARIGQYLPSIPDSLISEAELSALLTKTKCKGGRPVIDTTIYPTDTVIDRKYKRKIERSRAQTARKREAKQAAQRAIGKKGCDAHTQTSSHADNLPALHHIEPPLGTEWHDDVDWLHMRHCAPAQKQHVKAMRGRAERSSASTGGYPYLAINPAAYSSALRDAGGHICEANVGGQSNPLDFDQYTNSNSTMFRPNLMTLPGRGPVLTPLSPDPNLPPIGMFSFTPSAIGADQNFFTAASSDALLTKQSPVNNRSRQELLGVSNERFLRHVAEYMKQQVIDHSDQETIDGDVQFSGRDLGVTHHWRQTKSSSTAPDPLRRRSHPRKDAVKDAMIMPGDSASIVKSKYRLQRDRSKRAQARGKFVPKYPYSRIPQAEVDDLLQTRVSIYTINADDTDSEEIWKRSGRRAHMNGAYPEAFEDAHNAEAFAEKTFIGGTVAGLWESYGPLSQPALSEAGHFTTGQPFSASQLAPDGGWHDLQALLAYNTTETGLRGGGIDCSRWSNLGELGDTGYDLQDQGSHGSSSCLGLTDLMVPDWPWLNDLDLQEGLGSPAPESLMNTDESSYMSLDSLLFPN